MFDINSIKTVTDIIELIDYWKENTSWKPKYKDELIKNKILETIWLQVPLFPVFLVPFFIIVVLCIWF